jgi:hypothetical protein
VVVQNAPSWFSEWRTPLDFNTVEYGVGGIKLFRPRELLRGQVGFAVGNNGESLVGTAPGDWRPEWVVIGYETACGDPIFASVDPPHPVFSAMHGQGSWEPKLLAPSLAAFMPCLKAFQAFAAGRSSPTENDANPHTPAQQAQFLAIIRSLTNDNQVALGFWAVQIELDLDEFHWPA